MALRRRICELTLGCRPWERGRPARSGPQARHMGKRTGRLRFRETPSLPGPCLGRGSGWLRCVAPVGALRARCPRSRDIAPGAVPRWGGGTRLIHFALIVNAISAKSMKKAKTTSASRTDSNAVIAGNA